MQCPNCGAAAEPGQNFCLECGTPLQAACPTCGAPRVPGARFCGNCGTRLSEDAGAPAGIPPGPAPGARPAPVSERRLVTVLFADLVGFTTLAEGRDPEEVRELLSRYFELAREVIGRYGGTVEKFIGDAVMAVWGTPTTHEDDAERAVRAALDLVDAVPATLATEGYADPPRARAGVLSGEAAVTIGASGEGMVAGDLVNTASRLQSAALPGTVLVGEATVRATDSAIAFQPAGEQELKGKALPVAAWKALRIVAQRGGIGRAEILEPPFVGREEELRLLKDQLHAAGREGKARLVSVVGQAGIGKSRLVWELLKYVDGLTETVYWHEGRSPSYGEGVTFWALGEMVRRRAGIAEADDEATTRDKLHAALAEWLPDDAERRWVEPHLAALLGLEETPAGQREELFAAWRTFFERVAERGTAVLVFEDLQWADAGMIDFVEHLLEWARARPILVITLARPELLERRPGWGAAQRSFLSLRLEPLPAPAMARLLAGLVPGVPPDALQRIVQQAEGVPLYAVEIVRMLLDEGRLTREGATYRLDGPGLADVVPPSLQALIAARLDALGADDRALLQDAAVLGQAFTAAALAAVAERETDEVEARLRELARKELVSLDVDPRSPERGQYRFVQGLIREVAYGTLARRDRRARHLAAARHYESVGDDEYAGILASHYVAAYEAAPEGAEAAAVAAQARLALRSAAERATALHSYDQALGFIELALRVATDDAERAELWLQAAASAEAAARFEVAEGYGAMALDWYRRRDDADVTALAAAAVLRSMIFRSRIEPALAVAEGVRAETEGRRSDIGDMRLLGQLARIYIYLDRPDDALPVVEAALIAAERVGHLAELAQHLITKSWIIALLRRPAEADALLVGAIDLADRGGVLGAQLRGRFNRTGVLSTDQPRVGLSVAREGIELARRYGLLEPLARLAGNGAVNAVSCGEWDWALALASEVESRDLPAMAFISIAAPIAVIRALRGDPEASAALEAIAPTTRDSTSPQDVSVQQAAMAQVQLYVGRLEAATEAARRAAVAYPRGTDAVAARVVLARACLWRDDPDGVRAALAELASLGYRGGWLDASVATLESGVAALEGRTAEAAEAYREAAAAWRRLDLPLDLALCQLEAATLLPGTDLARAAADEAREILRRLDSPPLLARLEAVTGGAAGAAGAAGAPPARVERSEATVPEASR
ncbi:MAG TPA: adenylate/guanylate cyclase domain-containing protein [Candidatus Limnocylindrales bacterium]|nr:adenylate/guanylate cyclase domain-containing protein [Candidatus Limnocylindrales bacterium]